MIKSIAKALVIATVAVFVIIQWVAPLVDEIDERWLFTLPEVLKPLGWLCLLGGLLLAGSAELAFLREGKATGGMRDAPRQLVVVGPFRWVRNPMFLGFFSVLLGLALLLASPTLFAFKLLVMLLMHLVVVFFDEPRLEKRFGDSYRAYRQTVPRWIPRHPSGSGAFS